MRHFLPESCWTKYSDCSRLVVSKSIMGRTGKQSTISFMLLRCKTDAARLRGGVLFYKKGARTDTRTAFSNARGKRNER